MEEAEFPIWGISLSICLLLRYMPLLHFAHPVKATDFHQHLLPKQTESSMGSWVLNVSQQCPALRG